MLNRRAEEAEKGRVTTGKAEKTEGSGPEVKGQQLRMLGK